MKHLSRESCCTNSYIVDVAIDRRKKKQLLLQSYCIHSYIFDVANDRFTEDIQEHPDMNQSKISLCHESRKFRSKTSWQNQGRLVCTRKQKNRRVRLGNRRKRNLVLTWLLANIMLSHLIIQELALGVEPIAKLTAKRIHN